LRRKDFATVWLSLHSTSLCSEGSGEIEFAVASAAQESSPLGRGKHQLAAGRGGVDGILEAAEPDAALSQGADGVDQVPERPAEAVQFPDDQDVAGPQLVQDLGEVGRSLRAPLAVSVNTR
jgi:hypothetical protein